MSIQEWFDSRGSYEDGLELYKQLPGATAAMVKSFTGKTPANHTRLKSELYKAMISGFSVAINPAKKVQEVKASEPKTKASDSKPDTEFLKNKAKELADQSSKVEFQKETLSMYPPELHPVYRQRINDYYLACELKIKLNSLDDDAIEEALDLILSIDKLWTRIDKAWEVLHHWRDHRRILPFFSEVDYSKLSSMQLFKEKTLLESRISKRKKTLQGIFERYQDHPEDRALLNAYNKKKEELEQLILNLEKIKEMIKNG